MLNYFEFLFLFNPLLCVCRSAASSSSCEGEGNDLLKQNNKNNNNNNNTNNNLLLLLLIRHKKDVIFIVQICTTMQSAIHTYKRFNIWKSLVIDAFVAIVIVVLLVFP